MTRKIHLVTCGLTALALPTLALAEMSFDGDTLAKVESALDFCAQRNPADATKYADLAKQFTKGADESEVAQLRDSADYKSAYEANLAALREASESEAAETCDGIGPDTTR
jgi:hypothetical protein